jgi:ABC-2 type transport system permease protein
MPPAGQLYLALGVAGFRRSLAYPFALVNGLATNVFFGLVRTALFFALYARGEEVRGLDQSEALTYVWMLQALFGVVWASWLWELAQEIRSGDFAVELLRPGDPYVRLLAFDLGRCIGSMTVRTTVPLLGAALLLRLTLPSTGPGWATLGLSVLLATVAAFEIRFLICTLAFWTPDYRGVFQLFFIPVWLLSGFLVPIEYFPAGLRAVAEVSPLVALLVAPVRVAIGHDVAAALAVQVAWVVVLGVLGRAVLGVAGRRMMVHGG